LISCFACPEADVNTIYRFPVAGNGSPEGETKIITKIHLEKQDEIVLVTKNINFKTLEL